MSFGTVNPGPQKNKRFFFFLKLGVEWGGEDERARVCLLSVLIQIKDVLPGGCLLTASNRPQLCSSYIVAQTGCRSRAYVASEPSSPTAVVGMGWGSGNMRELRLRNWTKVRHLSSETKPGSTHSFRDFLSDCCVRGCVVLGMYP